MPRPDIDGRVPRLAKTRFRRFFTRMGGLVRCDFLHLVRGGTSQLARFTRVRMVLRDNVLDPEYVPDTGLGADITTDTSLEQCSSSQLDRSCGRTGQSEKRMDSRMSSSILEAMHGSKPEHVDPSAVRRRDRTPRLGRAVYPSQRGSGNADAGQVCSSSDSPCPGDTAWK